MNNIAKECWSRNAKRKRIVATSDAAVSRTREITTRHTQVPSEFFPLPAAYSIELSIEG